VGLNSGKCPAIFLESDACYSSSNSSLCLQESRRGLRHLFAVNHHFSFITSFKGVLILKLKGIVHNEIHFWYVLAYLKGIQDVGVFVSAVVSILIDLHYLTDRQERFDLKIPKLKLLRKQRHLHLGCP